VNNKFQKAIETEINALKHKETEKGAVRLRSKMLHRKMESEAASGKSLEQFMEENKFELKSRKQQQMDKSLGKPAMSAASSWEKMNKKLSTDDDGEPADLPPQRNRQRAKCRQCGGKPGFRHVCGYCGLWFCPQCVTNHPCQDTGGHPSRSLTQAVGKHRVLRVRCLQWIHHSLWWLRIGPSLKKMRMKLRARNALHEIKELIVRNWDVLAASIL